MSQAKQLLFIFILLSGLLSHAQSYQLDGKVVNAEQQPVYFANLVLLERADSTVVKGTSSDEFGNFTIEDLQAGDFILKASYVGYQSIYRDVEIDQDLQLAPLTLLNLTQELEGVTVEQHGPVLEKKAGMLIFHVENTNLTSLSSYEILQQTPGVLTFGGGISIKNSKTTIYINDRRVYLSDAELKSFLESYSGSNIASIEIILNPSAKYDADGGYVLNIVTSKNVSVGYKGSVEATYKQGVFPKYVLGTNHYYKNDFLDMYVGYSLQQNKLYKEDQGYIYYFEGDQQADHWNWDLYKTTKFSSHNFNTIFDFTLDTNNQISFSTDLSYSPNKDVVNQVDTRMYDSSNASQGSYTSVGSIDNDNTNLALNATYTRDINSQNSLSIQANYVYYQDAAHQRLSTEYFNADGSFDDANIMDTDASQLNTIYTLQGDYSLTFDQEGMMEFGAKYSGIHSKSEMLYLGPYVPLNGEDDRFKYQEDNLALYVNYSKDWEAWSLQTGLRAETTSTDGDSQQLGQINEQDYLELFPNIGLQHQLAENHQVGFYYKRGINRPRYQSLNPYRYYINEDNFVSGNPNLTRAIENRVGLEYTYKSNYIFDLYYQHIKGDLNRFSFQNNEDKFLYSSVFNAREFYQYSLDFTHYSYLTKKWFVSLYSSAYYYHIGFNAIESGNQLESLNTFGFFGQLNNWYTLSNDRTWTAMVNLEYLAGYYFGNYYLKNRFKSSIGLRKTIWDGRGELNLNLSDVLNTANIPVKVDYLNQYNGYTAKLESRVLSISFRYKFGNYKLEDNQRKLELKEQERLEEEEQL